MVLNSEGNPVKSGEIGEIAARGGNIMKGYFNDKEETDKVIKQWIFIYGRSSKSR